MISVQCPNPSCGRRLNAPDSTAGHTAKCPLCGTRMTVPHAPVPSESLELQQDEATPLPTGPWNPAMPGPGPIPAAPAAPVAGNGLPPRSRLPLVVGGLAALIVAGVVAFLLTRGTARGSKGVFGTAPAIQSAYQGPKVELKILMNPAVYAIVETSEDHGTQKIKVGGQTQEQATTSSLRVDGVIEIRPPAPATGERHITYTCTAVKMDQQQGPMRLSYDSEKPDTSSGNPGDRMLGALLGSMVGWQGVQVYSKDGKFLRLEGLEHLLSKMSAAPGGAQMMGAMKKMLEPFLRDTLTRHWGKLIPTDPVAPGDSWKRTVDLNQVPMFGKMDFEFTCWLTDVVDGPGGKVAVLVCDGQARLRDRDVDMSGMGMPGAPKMTVDDMTLRIRQNVTFPLAVGLATEVAGEVDVEGSMTINVLGQKATSDLQQNSKFGYALTSRK